jgi:hypothetical protein
MYQDKSCKCQRDCKEFIYPEEMPVFLCCYQMSTSRWMDKENIIYTNIMYIQYIMCMYGILYTYAIIWNTI